MSETRTARKIKWQLYVFPAAAVVVFLWAWYLLEQNTNWRIVQWFQLPREEPVSILIPLLGTVVTPTLGWLLWRRAVDIAANGVTIAATIVAIGGVVSEMQDVKLSYEFDGHRYEQRKTVSTADVDGREPGDTLEIIVDRRKPSRFVVP